jgi:hypothetical protein
VVVKPGVGGSGKQSVTKLGSYLCGHVLMTLSAARVNVPASYAEDLRLAVRTSALHAKPFTLMIGESDIRPETETILQAVNSLMCTGEVPGLFTKDEMIVMTSELGAIAAKQVVLVFGIVLVRAWFHSSELLSVDRDSKPTALAHPPLPCSQRECSGICTSCCVCLRSRLRSLDEPSSFQVCCCDNDCMHVWDNASIGSRRNFVRGHD